MSSRKPQRSGRVSPLGPAAVIPPNPNNPPPTRSKSRMAAAAPTMSTRQQQQSQQQPSSSLYSFFQEMVGLLNKVLGNGFSSPTRSRGGSSRQPSMSPQRYLPDDANEGDEEEMEKHFEWRRYARQAKEAEARGDLHQALSTYQSVLQSDTLQAGMRDNDRYQVHISVGRLQLRLGLLQSAETTLFHATCLVSEPHEAYLELAKIKTSQGLLEEACMHYKHYLFYRPESLSALQELGCLLIISGSINEGRHYLARALSQWERDVRRLMARLRYQAQHSPIPFSRWFLDYMLSNLSMGPPPSFIDEDGQFAMLAEFIDRPQLFNARLHWELSTALWKVGLWPEARTHLRAARSMVDDKEVTHNTNTVVSGPPISANTGRVAALRLKLEFPPFIPSIDAGQASLDAWRRGLEEEEEKALTLDPDSVLEVFSTLPALLSHLTAWGTPNDINLLSSTIGTACPSLSPSPPTFPRSIPGKAIRVGLVSGLMFGNSIGGIAHSLIRLLPRPEFHISVFDFPSPYNGTLDAFIKQVDDLVTLPLNLNRARTTILSNHMDIVIVPDSLDALTYFLGYSRVAPIQMSFFAKGTTTGLPEIDYYLRPDAVQPRGTVDYFDGLIPPPVYSEQVLSLDGPSYLMPLLVSMAKSIEGTEPPSGPLRYEFYGQYFFEHQHVYILFLPSRGSALPHPAMDWLITSILEADPSAEVVLAMEEGPFPPNINTTQSTIVGHQLLLKRIIQHQGGSGDRSYLPRVRLMPILQRHERRELFALSSCILEPIPHGYFPTFAILEAVSLGVPVVSLGGVGAGLMDALGVQELGSSTITNFTKYVEAVVHLGNDKEFRTRVVDQIKEGMERESANCEQTVGRELGRAMKAVVGKWEEGEKQERKKRRKKKSKQQTVFYDEQDEEEEDDDGSGASGRRSRYRRGKKSKSTGADECP